MMSEKFQNKYRISSARATWHDYNVGAYFVTICTKNRERYFGKILDENGTKQMFLSEIGRCVEENLQNISQHYPYAEIPMFVVMPDHIHAIVIIDGDKTPYERHKQISTQATTSVETWRAASLQRSDQMVNIANRQGWLSVAIGGIKSAVSKYAHQHHIDFVWQTRFHDRIIRNRTEMNALDDDVETNVLTWHDGEMDY